MGNSYGDVGGKYPLKWTMEEVYDQLSSFNAVDINLIKVKIFPVVTKGSYEIGSISIENFPKAWSYKLIDQLGETLKTMDASGRAFLRIQGELIKGVLYEQEISEKNFNSVANTLFWIGKDIEDFGRELNESDGVEVMEFY